MDSPQSPHRYVRGFVAEPLMLYRWLLEQVRWDTRMQARETASFGVPYDYSGMSYAPAEWPQELDALRRRVGAACSFSPNDCLLNHYADGTHRMGYRSDDAEELVPGTGIAIVSVGAEREMRFRRRNPSEREHGHAIVLEGGSLLFMSGHMQRDWQHAIPPAAEAAGRISLTFRELQHIRK